MCDATIRFSNMSLICTMKAIQVAYDHVAWLEETEQECFKT
jgi:hypothetical protein